MPTQDKNSFHIRSALQINSLTLNLTKAQQLPKTSTHKLKNSSSQKLKLLSFILRHHSIFRSVLAKILVKRSVNSYYFYPLTSWGLSIFKTKTCILPHLAFLVWLLTHIFFKPKYLLLAPKNLLFVGYFAFISHVFHGSIRFCLYNCCGCLCFSSRILQHLAPRLAPKCAAFSTKTHSILHQNALHFAAKRTPFSRK